MATATEPFGRTSEPMPYQLTVEQYHAMIDSRILPEGARVELLGGKLVEKMTKDPPHNFGVFRLGELLRRLLPQGMQVREEKPIDLDAWSQPEPDLVIARGDSTAYRAREPRPADILLIIEVAESSYDYDRGEKWRRYAAAKVPFYGILNIGSRRCEHYGAPRGRDVRAAYREVALDEADADFPVTVEGQEVGRIAVRDLLP